MSEGKGGGKVKKVKRESPRSVLWVSVHCHGHGNGKAGSVEEGEGERRC